MALARAELAWAAGFFDGEGSTFACARGDRPDYYRLDVVVPQHGDTEIPAVLRRFRAAMLGLGSIDGPDALGKYRWRSRGFEEAQAVIALLWWQLGSVKRAQANAAICLVTEQYRSERYKPRGPRRRTRCRLPASISSDRPSLESLDRAWAAGFLDAEGSFYLPRGSARKHGPRWSRIRASASQHGKPGEPAEVLVRLRSILGGRIERHGEPDDFRWVVEGPEHIERILALIGHWLGPVKREQARAAQEAFRRQVRLKGNTTNCVRGHPYSGFLRKGGRVRKYCTTCTRMKSRELRAKQGIAPRAFANLARRYTV